MRKAILLVAYGASSTQGRAALVGFDGMARSRHPDVTVRWAYTSLRIRERLAGDRCKSDSVHKAMHRLHLERFDAIAVQPLQVIAGKEYAQVLSAVESVASQTDIVWKVGLPMLADGADVAQAARAALTHVPRERHPEEDVVFMGHGTGDPPAMARYVELGEAIRDLDGHVHVGTMSGDVGLEDILPRLTSERVWLMPLLSVVGRHALEDMAGGEERSWNTRIQADGRICIPVLRGMAEHPDFAEIWLRHLAAVAETL
jgi:sirohydrochlorin cobaltochelatase